MTEDRQARKDKAKELRAQGLTYWEIGLQIGVSDTMARTYVLDIPNKRPAGTDPENAPFICRQKRTEHKYRCNRRTNHKGIHLANDAKGRLIYWE